MFALWFNHLVDWIADRPVTVVVVVFVGIGLALMMRGCG